MKRKIIGKIRVDSGLIIITDPHTIQKEWDKSEEDTHLSYNSCIKASLSEQSAGELKFINGDRGAALAMSTTYTDGLYKIYGTYNDSDELLSITIKF